MSILRIETLGTFAVYMDEQPLASLTSRKAQALLVYLMCHPGQYFSREHLQTLLWSDTPMLKARANLRQTLRKLLNAVPVNTISQRDLDIGFNHACPYWFDLEHVTQDDSLYSGAFMLGFSLRGAAVWEEWLFSKREAVTASLIEQWSKEAQRATDLQSAAVAIRYWQRVIELHPWMETPYRGLMQLYLQSGDRAAALAQYQSLKQSLNEELGVEPSAETQSLHERILSAETTRSNLPNPDLPSPFVGRSDEIAIITTTLRNPSTRLLTLLGFGGSGKTRLAIASAAATQSHFFDGTYFVDLTSSGLTLTATTIATVIGLKLTSRGSHQTELIDYLRHRRVLLVLDNFESVLNDANTVALVQAIIRSAPKVTMLVTSRAPLRLRSEQIFPIEGLGLTTDAPALFQRAARRVNMRFSADAAPIQHICQLVAGIPLALELAASLLRLLTVQELCEEIERDIKILQANYQDMPPHHRSIEVVLQSTWDRLATNQQAILAKLALFRGGFTRESARAIAQATPFALSELIALSLVQPQGNGRFTLHPLLCQFAAKQLTNDISACQQTHGDWFIEQLLAYQTDAHVCNQFVRAEKDNLFQAWLNLASQRRVALLNRAADTIHHSLMQLNQYEDAIELYQRSIQLFERNQKRPEAEDGLLANLYSRYTSVLLYFGRTNDALIAAERSIMLATRVEDDAGIALAYSTSGDIKRRAGQLKEGLRELRFALDLYRRSEDQPRHCARVLNHIAIVEMEMGHEQDALDKFVEALALTRQQQDANGEAYVLHNIARIDQKAGRFIAAQQRFEASFALFEQLQNHTMRGSCLSNLALIGIAQNDLELAKRLLISAETHLDKSIRADHHALLQRVFGRLALKSGRLLAAKARLDRAYQLAATDGHASLAVRMLSDLIEITLAANEYETASSLLATMVHEVVGFSADVYQQLVRLNRADYLVATNQRALAQPLLTELRGVATGFNWFELQRLALLLRKLDSSKQCTIKHLKSQESRQTNDDNIVHKYHFQDAKDTL